MILICDDDATIRSSLSLVLKRAGYEAERFVRIFRRSDFVAGAFQHQGQ